MTTRLSSSALAALLLLGLCAGTTAGQPPSGLLAEQEVNPMILGGVSEYEALRKVLVDNDVPAGIVLPAGCEEKPGITFAAVPGMTLRQALDEITVLTGSRSRWIVADSVVNVVPRKEFSSLLSVRIDQVSVPNVLNLTQAVDRLLQVPAVKEMMAAQRLVLRSRGSIWSALSRDGKQPAPVPLEIKDMTLLDALNLLAKTRGNAVWVYSERACSGLETSLTLQFVRH